MDTEERLPAPNGASPFERIRRTNAAGAQYWSSRDFAQVLGYSDYRNFEQAMKRAKTACFNSGQQVDDHFGEITEMAAASIKKTGVQGTPATRSPRAFARCDGRNGHLAGRRPNVKFVGLKAQVRDFNTVPICQNW